MPQITHEEARRLINFNADQYWIQAEAPPLKRISIDVQNAKGTQVNWTNLKTFCER